MKNLTPEIIEKAMAAKTAEELAEIIKSNNVELTEEESKACFAQLNENGAVSDDELDAVAGGIGGSIIADLEKLWKNRKTIFDAISKYFGFNN